MDATLAPVDRLNLCTNSAELRQAVDVLCADFGPILNVTLLCGNQNHGRTMCVIDFYPENQNINLFAMKFGGRMFGYHSVIFNLTLPSDFGCIKGFPSSSPACSCTLHK